MAYEGIFETAIRTPYATTDLPGAYRDALLGYNGSYAHRVALLDGLERIQSALGPMQSGYAMLWPTGAFVPADALYDREAADLMRSVSGVVFRHDRTVRVHAGQRS